MSVPGLPAPIGTTTPMATRSFLPISVAKQDPVDTRARILDSAMELFAVQGYQRTSLRQIAGRLGITKAAVLYHFPTKDQILAVLTEPLLFDLETALAEAARMDPETGRWAAIEGVLEVYLRHRKALHAARYDIAILTQQPTTYQRFIRIAMSASGVIAGPGASPVERVRACQAMAVLGDPVLLFDDIPVDELRAAILAGVRQLLAGYPPPRASGSSTGGSAMVGVRAQTTPENAPRDDSTPHAGRAKTDGVSRRPGRPQALSPEQVAIARDMVATGTQSVSRVAAALGVSRATLYRHLGHDPAISRRLVS